MILKASQFCGAFYIFRKISYFDIIIIYYKNYLQILVIL
jgi:hypothetical protein